ncbi:MAG TPA: hypothetical protein VGG09_15720 [Acidimicrobiales bacterium]
MDAGRSVELFRELDIEDHPAFAAVMEEFTSTGEASRSTLLRAANEYLRQSEGRGAEVLVLDALFGYLPSLLAWGDTDAEIDDFFRRMAELFSDSRVLEIHLRGDLRAALDRAVTREGEDWLTDQVKKTASFRGAPPIATPDEAVSYLNVLAARAASLLERAPWTVSFVDADAGEDDVLAQALEALQPYLQ